MLVKITHQTELSYDSPISESAVELRMSPRQEGDQHRLSFKLAVGPATSIASYFDWLGNTVHTLSINGFHRQMRVIATSVVETNRPVPNIEACEDRWPIPPSALDYTMCDYLQFAPPITDTPLLRQLAQEVAPRAGEPLAAVTRRLLHLVHDRFTYQKGVTTAASSITDILQHGRGVCQDFTHLLIGLGRCLAIPSRYVSGFIHRRSEEIRGHAQTHAWCEFCFPSRGWVGFDPTNNCLVGPNFIKIGHGRDFRDVPPNKGVYRGAAQETIDVTVEMEDLDAVPPALAAERFETINLPVHPHRSEEQSDAVTQQQEQQQQELKQQQEQQQQQ